MGFVNAGWVRVNDEGAFEPGQEGNPGDRDHAQLTFSSPVEITENGYIYIWVSNQSEETKIWFDDLTVTHMQTLVVQATDYGVWGDVMREQKSDESVYRFGYQGQFAEKDKETGWNHFELREYDPIVGRWLRTDPMRQHSSPYLSMGNNPVNSVDPNGGDDWYLNNETGEVEWINGHEEIEGYTYLGEDLTFSFSSFIDRADWDGPNPWFDVSGEKMFNSVTLDFDQDEYGNLIGLRDVSFTWEIMTNDGGFKGVPWNSLGNTQTRIIGPKNFVVGFENHSHVPFLEAFGLMVQGYAKVNVAQKLLIVGSLSGKLIYKSYTDIFPSASLYINETKVMYYRQPLYRETHGLFTRPAPNFYERQGISLKRGGY